MASLSDAQKKLTLRATAYVHARLEGMNPREACVAAGYSRSYALGKCYTLENDPSIKREIQKGLKRIWDQHAARLNRAIEVVGDALEARVSDMVDPKTGEMLPPNKLPKMLDNVIDSYTEETTFNKNGSKKVKRTYKKANKLVAADMAIKIKGGYAPEKQLVAHANADYSDLYGQPDNVLEADTIDEPEPPKLEEKPNGKRI